MKNDDLISRQAAIDAIRASASKYTGFMAMEMYTDDDAVEAINGVLSAQPKRKKNKWVKLHSDTFHCRLCGSTFIVLQGKDSMNYCPSCGANMREEE